jgi:hypothetical protein
LLFKPMQGRVQGPVLDQESVIGPQADRLTDSVAMLGTPLQSPQD